MAAAETSYYSAFGGPDAGPAGARRSSRGRRLRHRRRNRRLLDRPASRRARLPGRPPGSASDRLWRLRPQRRPGDRRLCLRPAKLEQQVGFENARRMWDISVEGLRLIRDRVARHAIDCDLHWGQLHVAIKERQRADLLAEQTGTEGSLRLSAAAIHGARRGGIAARDEAVLRGTLRRGQRSPSSAELHARPGRGGRSRGCADLRELSGHGSAHRRPRHRQHRARQRARAIRRAVLQRLRRAARSLRYARGSCRWGLTSSPPSRWARRVSRS